MKRFRLFFILSGVAYLCVSCTDNVDRQAKDVRNAGTVIPEYNRFLKKVAISLGHQNITLAEKYELLERLPSYTGIYLILPDSSIQSVRSYLRDTQFGARTILFPYDSNSKDDGCLHFLDQNSDSMVTEKITRPVPVQFGTTWTQDLFEVVTNPDSTHRLVGSAVHMFLWTENNDNRDPVTDNDYLHRFASMGMEVIKLPIVFNGGNLLFDEIRGHRIAFCGGDIVRNTRTVREVFPGIAVPDSELVRIIKDAFNVDEVVIISGKNRPQPILMFHLDQAVLFLPGGVAGVTSIVGSLPDNPKARARIDEVEEYLAGLRGILTGLGYTVVAIETTVRNVLNYEYYTNAIPFIHAVSGERTLLMPVFSDGQSPVDCEIERKNTELFESLGYHVVPVPSLAQKVKGGPHCMVNVIE